MGIEYTTGGELDFDITLEEGDSHQFCGVAKVVFDTDFIKFFGGSDRFLGAVKTDKCIAFSKTEE